MRVLAYVENREWQTGDGWSSKKSAILGCREASSAIYVFSVRLTSEAGFDADPELGLATRAKSSEPGFECALNMDCPERFRPAFRSQMHPCSQLYSVAITSLVKIG